MAKKKNRKSAPPAIQQSPGLTFRQTNVSIGPIPSAETIEAYRAVRPDLPDLIIDTWQADAKHRRDMGKAETYVKKSLVMVEKAKVVVVSLFSLGMLALAAYLAYKGQYEYASGVVVSPVLIGIIDALKQKR